MTGVITQENVTGVFNLTTSWRCDLLCSMLPEKFEPYRMGTKYDHLLLMEAYPDNLLCKDERDRRAAHCHYFMIDMWEDWKWPYTNAYAASVLSKWWDSTVKVNWPYGRLQPVMDVGIKNLDVGKTHFHFQPTNLPDPALTREYFVVTDAAHEQWVPDNGRRVVIQSLEQAKEWLHASDATTWSNGNPSIQPTLSHFERVASRERWLTFWKSA